MIGVSPPFWATLGLSVLLVAVAGILVVQIAKGHIAVTIPWGRRMVPVAQRRITVAAEREIVVDALRAAARGRSPGRAEGERTQVLDEEAGLVVNETLTRSWFGLVRSVELIRVASDRVSYRHLAGPLPGTEEEFLLDSVGAETVVSYRGQIPLGFWGLGRLVARLLIVPEYDRLIAVHLQALKEGCEARSRRRNGNPGRREDR